MVAYLVLVVGTEADLVGSFAHFVNIAQAVVGTVVAVEVVELAVPIVDTMIVQIVTIEDIAQPSLAVNENYEDH